MSSPSVADLCAAIKSQADRVALVVTAQATEIMALRRQVLALTDELADIRDERDSLRNEIARQAIVFRVAAEEMTA